MLDESYLAIILDGPMQSWGLSSRFERRTTSLYPTKSALVGILAAAMGIDKHAEEEAKRVMEISQVKMTTVVLPKMRLSRRNRELEVRRMQDYHTVGNTKSAEGKVKETVQTYRHYLLDARFGIILHGNRSLIRQIAEALENPVWGIWLGRKSCIPATPLFVALDQDLNQVWRILLTRAGYDTELNLDAFPYMEEVDAFADGVDTLRDQPTTFAQPNAQTLRRVRLHQKK